jgi:hypothetical protein
LTFRLYFNSTGFFCVPAAGGMAARSQPLGAIRHSTAVPPFFFNVALPLMAALLRFAGSASTG